MSSCPFLDFFAKCRCSGGMVCSFCMQLTIVAIVIVFGVLVAWKPKKIIDMQTALYRPFNWRLEPISMEKEIKNTRLMGLVLLILGVISLIYILLT